MWTCSHPGAASTGTKRSDDEADRVTEQPLAKNASVVLGSACSPTAGSSAETLGASSASFATEEKHKKEQEKKEATERKKQLLQQQAAERAKQAGMQLQNVEGKATVSKAHS